MKKKNYTSKSLIMISLLALCLGLVIGFLLFSGEKKKSYKNDMNLVYDTLKNSYIDKIDEDKINEAAIKGMIDYINDKHKDKYTNYYNEEDKNEFNEALSGQFYGTGTEIYKYKDNPVTILRVFENSPAEKAGLKAGDQYIKIDGKDVTKKSADDLSKLIKGKVQKKYELVVKRKKKELKFDITTDIVDIPSVESKVIKKDNTKIGYIYIGIFAANTDEQFSKKLEEMKKDDISKLIIDLRNDSGGDLDSVINIASNFMNKDKIIVKIVDKDKKTNKYSVKNSQDKYDIVVLTNKNSASASEVLASSLKDNCEAKLVGETTYGKGSVQKVKTLSTGAMLKYTVETWETSKDVQINNKGIKPTVEVKLDKKYYETFEEEDDNQLQKAIKILLDK